MHRTAEYKETETEEIYYLIAAGGILKAKHFIHYKYAELVELWLMM